MNEEILYNEIYEKTKDCGRTQFVKLLMDKERENQELKKLLEEKNKTKIFVEQNLEEAYGDGLYLEHLEKENQQLKEQLEASEKARKDAIEFINGVFEMSLYTKSKSLDEEGIEEILDILDIDKGE